MVFTLGGDYFPSIPKEDLPKGPVKVFTEKRGKSFVTIIKNLPLNEQALEELSKKLKKQFGCGGTIKEKIIELQGDRVEEVKKYLAQEKAQKKT